MKLPSRDALILAALCSLLFCSITTRRGSLAALELEGPFKAMDGRELGTEASVQASERGVSATLPSERTGFHVDPLRCSGAPHSSLRSCVTCPLVRLGSLGSSVGLALASCVLSVERPMYVCDVGTYICTAGPARSAPSAPESGGERAVAHSGSYVGGMSTGSVPASVSVT